MVTQLALVMAVLAGAAMAPAQPGTVTAGGARWTPTEPLVGDMNPVGTSQRAMPVDLRLGSNFDRVYKLDARPRFFGGAADGDYYMRMNGAVMAVFPRSAYGLRGGAVTAEVPAGTVFSIGGDVRGLMNLQPEETRNPASNFVDRSARPRPEAQPERPRPAPPERPEPPQRPDNRAPREGERSPANEVRSSATTAEPPPPSIWWDEPYRQQRVGELLDRALSGK